MDLLRTSIFMIGIIWTANGLAESPWNKPSPPPAKPIPITVYRSPNCSCCGIWLKHLKQHDFAVTDIKTADVNSVKKKAGIDRKLASCHTAMVDGYVIEGHVPAADIKTMLREKPDFAGLSVPGMPHGTPGMEMSGRRDPFSVISFTKDGRQQKFREYRSY